MKAIKVKKDYEYNDNTKQIIHLISYPKCIPDIVGSSSMRFNYSNDYDLFTIVSSHQNFDTLKIDVLNKFTQMFKEFKLNKNIYFIELMAGVDKDNKAIKWTMDEVINNKKSEYKFTEILNKESVIKIEIISYFNGIFTPFSNVFEFKINNVGVNQKLTTIDTVKSLVKEVKKYHEKKNYMKVLKRLFIISLQTKNKALSVKLIDLFNSDIGKIYKVKSSVESIKDVLEQYKDKQTVERIKNNVEMLKEFCSSQSAYTFNEEFYNKFDTIYKSNSIKTMLNSMEFIIEEILKNVNKLVLNYIHSNKINYKKYLN